MFLALALLFLEHLLLFLLELEISLKLIDGLDVIVVCDLKVVLGLSSVGMLRVPEMLSQMYTQKGNCTTEIG